MKAWLEPTSTKLRRLSLVMVWPTGTNASLCVNDTLVDGGMVVMACGMARVVKGYMGIRQHRGSSDQPMPLSTWPLEVVWRKGVKGVKNDVSTVIAFVFIAYLLLLW
nr:hypothetical protein Iba_chr01bCG6410 [Ipomoea batatas]